MLFFSPKVPITSEQKKTLKYKIEKIILCIPNRQHTTHI